MRNSSGRRDRKSTRLNSSHSQISYAVFCLKKNVHADGEAPAEVLLEPVFWSIFSLGGFITAFLFPVTLFLLFFAAPLHLWPTDPAAYATFLGHWKEPLVRLFFFVLIGGAPFPRAHPPKFLSVGAGFKSPAAGGVLGILLYGRALFWG